MHIGYKIKKLRVWSDLTQDQLAQKIGRTKALISYIEKTGVVNHNTLLDIAKALKLKIEDIENFDEKQNLQKDNIENIESLKNQIESLKRENELLNDLVAHQKMTIQLLQKKK